MRSGGTCSCSFALSGCSDPDDSLSAPLGSARWGAGTGAPFMESASTNRVQPTGTGSICMLQRTPRARKQSCRLCLRIQVLLLFCFFSALRFVRRSWSADEDGSQSGARARDFSHPEESRPGIPSVAFVYPTVTWISIGSDAQRRTGLIYTGAQPWWNWFDGNQRTLPCRRSR